MAGTHPPAPMSTRCLPAGIPCAARDSGFSSARFSRLCLPPCLPGVISLLLISFLFQCVPLSKPPFLRGGNTPLTEKLLPSVLLNFLLKTTIFWIFYGVSKAQKTGAKNSLKIHSTPPRDLPPIFLLARTAMHRFFGQRGRPSPSFDNRPVLPPRSTLKQKTGGAVPRGRPVPSCFGGLRRRPESPAAGSVDLCAFSYSA